MAAGGLAAAPVGTLSVSPHHRLSIKAEEVMKKAFSSDPLKEEHQDDENHRYREFIV